MDALVRLPCVQRPRKAFPVELAQFHSEDYIEFLSYISPDHTEVRIRPPVGLLALPPCVCLSVMHRTRTDKGARPAVCRSA
jgi:hypothetical protein